MKKKYVVILAVGLLLFSIVFIIQNNKSKVSLYSEKSPVRVEEDNVFLEGDLEEHEYLEEKIAVRSTPGEMITEHRYYEYGEDNAFLEGGSEEHEYPEEKIAVQSTPGEMITEHEYIDYGE